MTDYSRTDYSRLVVKRDQDLVVSPAEQEKIDVFLAKFEQAPWQTQVNLYRQVLTTHANDHKPIKFGALTFSDDAATSLLRRMRAMLPANYQAS